jgi:hypothetical protein
MNYKDIIPVKEVINTIITIRGKKVMVDADLAILYNVEPRRLREQVRRNEERFPPDFIFQLNQKEKDVIIKECPWLERLKYSNSLPFAFSEHGCIMLASVLNSDVAVTVSLQVVRGFVQLREFLLTNKELAQKLDALESQYDKQFVTVFEAIKQLMSGTKEQTEKREPIGFKIKNSNKKLNSKI